MSKLILSTRNRHKIREISAIMAEAGAPVELIGLDNYPGAPEVEENGATLEDNALLKAHAGVNCSGLPSAADDTGLFVDALNGAPGIRAARYAGEDATYEANNRKLLAALAGVPAERRTARFVCVVSYVAPGVAPLSFCGELAGRIIESPRGRDGFGYDPIFVPNGSNRTLAEMSAAEKNRISHRNLAFRQLAVFLRKVARSSG
ncbi:MAG TPA: RdgB/HAM1 family non-canonical purine NTP pyrophosphatase [Planctomycetota bacterium]|nr:RdgB/HAM1 family non-canonical purine NTP pyrophosphatase [Planctomycetota bacterium]